MANRTRVAVLGIGLIAGLVAGLILGGWAGTPATAQPAPKPAEVGRYQISAYGGGNQNAARGAYIIDTATGEVFLMVDGGKPASLGTVPKEKK